MIEKKKEIKQDLENLEQTAGQTPGQIDVQSDLENFEQIDEHQANGHKKEKKSEAKAEKEVEKKKKDLKLEDIPGVGAATAEKLRDAGYANLLSVAVASPGELVEACGVGDAVARKMINFVRQKMDMGFESGEDLLKKRELVEKIITGSKALDAIFGGGIETGAVTEVYGAYGSGKCLSKDTPIFCFNNNELIFDEISLIYDKFNLLYQEKQDGDGFVLEIPNLQTVGISNRKINKTGVSYLYKEFADKILEIKTNSGRVLRITKNHKLLTFSNGLTWVPSAQLDVGTSIACPRFLNYESKDEITMDDAYFIGFFVAEGSRRSITNTDKDVIDWLTNYCNQKFGIDVNINVDIRENRKVCYNLGMRNCIREFIGKELGNSDSYTKFIPDKVLLGSTNIVKSFLAGYIDGDGYLSDGDCVELSTRSKKLSLHLGYLLNRIGVNVISRQKIIDNEPFYRLFVVGEFRESLNDLPYKIKTARYKCRNSSYGYPKEITSYISEIYGGTLGGNRGKHRKIIGKINSRPGSIAYDYLIGNVTTEHMNNKTMTQIIEYFEQGFKSISEANLLANRIEDLNYEQFMQMYSSLPFAFNESKDLLCLSGSTFTNYVQRGLPKINLSNVYKIKEEIIGSLTQRKQILLKAIADLKNAIQFVWDEIVEIKEINYNDFVYDLVVPENHMFVAGNMPTMLHNTSLGHQLSVNVTLPKEQGGANGIGIWIDTEGTFRPEFIKRLAIAKGLDPEKVLKDFKGVRAFNSDHQMLLAEKIEDLINEGLPIKLVVVDSLMGHFRSEFVGRGTLADRQQKLNKHMHVLLKLAQNHNIAVLITNQVMAKPDTFFGDPTEPIGGHIVAHNCVVGDTLIQLSDGSILPIKDITQPVSLPAVDFGNAKLDSAFCDWGSKRDDITFVYEIDTGNKIKVSGEHKFFRLNYFEIEEVETRNIKEGDYLVHLNSFATPGELQKLPEIDVKRLVKISNEGSNFVKKEFEKLDLKRVDVCQDLSIEPRQLRRVLNQNYPVDNRVINQFVQIGVDNKVYNYVENVETYKHRDLYLPEYLDIQFAQILGYFVGDGCIQDKNIRFKDQRFDVISYYKDLCEDLFNINCNVARVKDKNCYELSVNSVAISELITTIWDDLFLLISKSPKEVIAAFVKGFADAEGYVSKERPRISLAQKDPQILNYIQMLLLRFGIRSRRDTAKNKEGNFIEILLFDGKDFNKFAKLIGVTAIDKRKVMEDWMDYCDNSKITRELIPINRSVLWELVNNCGLMPSRIMKSRPKSYQFVLRKNLEKIYSNLIGLNLPHELKKKVDFIGKLLNGDLRFERVKKVTTFENNEPLYDISVPIRENYIANGFVTHNSTYRVYLRRGKKGTRVAKMVDAPAMPEAEAIFQVTDEGIKDV